MSPHRHLATSSILACLLLSFSPLLNAQTFGGEPVTLNGSAQIVGGTLRLTEAVGSQRGSAFVTAPFALDGNTSFSSFMVFRMHSGSGADGFTFTIHSDTGGASELGSGGGSLGYGGISPSIAVEADTFLNGGADPDANHIGINLNGSLTSVATATMGPNLDGGQPFYLWVDYDGTTDLLDVFINDLNVKPGTPTLSLNHDLFALLGDSVFVGFTAATGGLNNVHDIESWALDWGSAPTRGPAIPVAANASWALLALVLGVLMFAGLSLRRPT